MASRECCMMFISNLLMLDTQHALTDERKTRYHRVYKNTCTTSAMNTNFNHCNTGLLHVEISTEVCTCCSSKLTLQWISQTPRMIEPCFNFLNTLPVSKNLSGSPEYTYRERTFLVKGIYPVAYWGHQ